MTTLKEALALSPTQISELKTNLRQQIDKASEIGAYVEQLTNTAVQDGGSGVPILVKDNIQVENWSITSCSKILQGYVAPYSATVVHKMKSAGMSPFGRANMDEFAMGNTSETSCYGVTRNPHDKSRIAGGSSGGSAAAVAGGIAVAALGSDTGGSIRQPASYCGCVGFKPTYGRVSRYGLGALSSSLDQIGTLTQNIEDSAILFDAISGYDKMDATSLAESFAPSAPALNGDKKFKIGVVSSFVEACTPDVKEAILGAIDTLKRQGHSVEEIEISDSDHHIACYYIISTAEASTNLSRFDGIRYGTRVDGTDIKEIYQNTRTAGFGEEVKRRIMLGNFVLSSGYFDAYYTKAQKVRTLIRDEMSQIFAKVDLIVAPVTPAVAHAIGTKRSPLESYQSDAFTVFVNLAGLPAISLPVGKGEGDMPVGMQIIGKQLADQSVLDCAFGLEKAIKKDK